MTGLNSSLVCENYYARAIFMQLLKLRFHLRKEKVPIIGIYRESFSGLCLYDCPVHIETRHLNVAFYYPVSKLYLDKTFLMLDLKILSLGGLMSSFLNFLGIKFDASIK